MNLRTSPVLKHVKWEPDRAELRRFGLSMLIGFGVLGGLSVLRHGGVAPLSYALWAVGVVLAACAVVPGLGRGAYLTVHVIANAVGYVVSHVLLFLIFTLLFVPLAALLRVTGKDLLNLRSGRATLWVERPAERAADSYYRQF
jgi:hypothetical protein